MQQILRAFAYATNGLLLVVPGVLGLTAFFTGSYQLGALCMGVALFGGLNVYAIRAGVKPWIERDLTYRMERVVLPARLSFFFGLWLFCVAFVAIVVFLYHIQGMALWPAVLFSVGILYLSVAMVPGASYIEINERGIVFSAAFVKIFYPWFQIAELQVMPIPRTHREGVGIRFWPEYQKRSAYQNLNRQLQGGFDRVVVGYQCGVDASELLRLMRNFQSRAAS